MPLNFHRRLWCAVQQPLEISAEYLVWFFVLPIGHMNQLHTILSLFSLLSKKKKIRTSIIDHQYDYRYVIYLLEESTVDLHFHKVLQWHEPKAVLLFPLVFQENPMDRLILNVLLCIRQIYMGKNTY